MGSLNDEIPSLVTSTLVTCCSIDTPNCLKIEIVCKQSSPSKKLLILVVPFARALNIIARWEIDLSPGTCTSPFKGCVKEGNKKAMKTIPQYFIHLNKLRNHVALEVHKLFADRDDG